MAAGQALCHARHWTTLCSMTFGALVDILRTTVQFYTSIVLSIVADCRTPTLWKQKYRQPGNPHNLVWSFRWYSSEMFLCNCHQLSGLSSCVSLAILAPSSPATEPTAASTSLQKTMMRQRNTEVRFNIAPFSYKPGGTNIMHVTLQHTTISATIQASTQCHQPLIFFVGAKTWQR